MSGWTQELDEAAVVATKTGCWHTLLFYLLCLVAAIPTSFLVFSQVFTNATPDHWCAPPAVLEGLLPDDLLKNLTVPKQNGTFDNCRHFSVDSRTLYAVLSEYVEERHEFVNEGGTLQMIKVKQLKPVTGETEREVQVQRIIEAILGVRSKTAEHCSNGWNYNTENYKRTLVTEFSLVCDQEWLPRTSNTLFWVGSIFGNVFFGWMADRYGRRPTLLLMIFVEVPLTIATSFPNSYWTYTGLRIAGGLFFPALYQVPFILALELMPPSKRTYTGIVVGMMFAGGMCLLAALAYLLRDWFNLSLATSVPFILLFSYFWLIPESPRWLVSRGRIADAEAVYRNLAKKNGILLPRGFLLELHKKIKSEEEQGIETTVMTTTNGKVTTRAKRPKEVVDRRISNMMSFKPEEYKSNKNETETKQERLERILALEVSEIVNKKSRLRREKEYENKGNFTDDSDDESQSRESLSKSTQTDPFSRSPVDTLRRKSLQFVAKIFSRDETEDVVESKRMDEENSEVDCQASPLDVLRYPNLRKKFCLLTFEWVAIGVVYNSSSYNAPNLGVNDYVAFFIGGAVEIPSYFIAWCCMQRFGRRWVLFTFMMVGGTACLSCLLVPEAWPWITVALAMLGRLCAAASFSVFYVVIGELLPTVLRSQAMGAASFIVGLGLLACPYIVYLAIYSRALPLTIMGILSVMAGVTSLFLPETLHQPLPQTLLDGELFGKDFKILSCVEKPRKIDEFNL